VFLYPVALQLDALGTFALVETGIFVVLLLIAFVFVWRRGALEWK
jgi:NADH-quinone oxidoreductase subunit A